jgi:hypothetical protein
MSTTVTTKSILADLEYRGINAFFKEIESGFKVPTCFAAKIMTIIKKEYDVKMKSTSVSTTVHSGQYCLMPYVDQTWTTIIIK